MDNLKFVGIIPARYASTRFPGKPLVKIAGVSMIERVWNRAIQVLDEVYVATDDNRIFDAVVSFGGKVIMTSPNHKSGTDRCEEAYIKSGSIADVIINIQGDEPFISPSQLEAIKECFVSENVDIATLIRKFNSENGFSALSNPNTPKVVVDKEMNACYFSRSVIPYVRSCNTTEWGSKHEYYTHVGMYAYRRNVLSEITKLPQSPLELAESLEQLRWIENGYTIRTAITDFQSIGIDTPEDLKAAEKYIQNNE